MVFYEAPHKLLRTLKDFYATFGNRKISIVRELTKIHEEVIRTTLQDAINRYETAPIKGELVLIVDGYKEEDSSDKEINLDIAIKMAQPLLEKGCTISDAAKQASKATGLKKSDIYKGLLKG